MLPKLPISLWRRSVPGAATALIVLALGLLMSIPWVAVDPRTPHRPAPPLDEDEQLERAIEEARANCLAATLLARDVPLKAPLFETGELRRALATALVCEQSMGELAAIEAEADWLAGLRRHTDRRDRTWEDVRFLVAALHWYLVSCRRQPREQAHADPVFDREAMVAFQDVADFEDLLGEWD